MSHFVEMIVNNFTKINQHVLLYLNFSVFVDLYSWCVNDSKITDEIFTIFGNNHKLRLPKFFVIGDLVVICITFTNLENAKSSVEWDGQIFNFFSVNSLKIQVQFVSCCLVGNTLEWSSL